MGPLELRFRWGSHARIRKSTDAGETWASDFTVNEKISLLRLNQGRQAREQGLDGCKTLQTNPSLF